MSVSFIEHARDKMEERGISEEEVLTVLTEGNPASARHGRQARAMVFPYNREWMGSFYPQKRAVVIYQLEDGDNITVITVISQYGAWEEPR